jgi:hypothetical protein
VTRLPFWFDDSACGTQRRWNFCNPNSSRKIRRHVIFAILKYRQRTLYEVNSFLLSIDRIASARSWVRDRPDFGSSEKVILPCRKCDRHFCTRDHLHASVPYTDSSSAWIGLALRSLRVKNQMTALCSIDNRNVRTSVLNFLSASLFESDRERNLNW